MGGLGNQLFQIYTTISYSLKCNTNFYFINEYELNAGPNTTIRYTYWETFFQNLKSFLKDSEILEFDKYRLHESSFHYTTLPYLNIPNNTIIELFGYFQSFKYFDNEYEYIYKLLNIHQLKILLSKKILQHLKNFSNEKNESIDLITNYFRDVICIHFRRGDYKKYTDTHPILPDEYYEKSLSFIISKNNYINKVIYFCEDEDIETVNLTIEKLKHTHNNLSFQRFTDLLDINLSDWEQLLSMSLCKYFIIANSSFSWWSAYLSDNYNKIVCYPSLWFTENTQKNVNDMCPLYWNKIQI